MSKIAYVGSSAGLTYGQEVKTGDMNSPFDYLLFCSCEILLGPLGRFTPNADGLRTAYCMRCSRCTVIDKGGQVTKVFPMELTVALGKKTG